MKNLPLVLTILLAVIVTGGRFFVPGHNLSLAGSYEAFAHLFVGGLIGAWIVSRKAWMLWIVGIMSVVELAAFLMR